MCLSVEKRTEHNGIGLPLLCEGGCNPRDYGRDDPRQGVRVVWIAGRPAMSLCKSCSDKLKALWAEADRGYREWEKAAA